MRIPFFTVFIFLLSIFATSADAGREQSDGPHSVKAADYKVGRLIRDIAFVDIDGKEGKFSDYATSEALVIVLNKVNCPVSRKFAATLNAIEKEYTARNVSFLYVNANKHATIEELREGIQKLGYSARYLPDLQNEIAKGLAAQTSTEAFILDKARTLVFRGPIDDQYGITYSLPAPRRHHLREALEAHLSGTKMKQTAWTAPGCLLGLPADTTPEPPITYHNRVSRIFQRNCQTCHRPGESGPFSLLTYRDALSHAAMIEFMVTKKLMPPWFASPQHGTFGNDRTLNEEDRQALLSWIASETPEGDAKDAPVPVKWTEGWNIGQPDAVITIPEPIQVPATGVVEYQYVTVKNPFDTDRWIEAMEIRPSAPQVVHHVLVLVRLPGQPVEDALDNFFAAMVPGNGVAEYAKGVGRFLPKDAELIFQIHYTPNGVAVADQPRLGIRFAKEIPKHELMATAAHDEKFKIPPGAPNHEVVAYYEFKKAGRIYSFMPHMHLRGKAFRYEAIYPDGKTEILLEVPRYDFNWQLLYELREPLDVPVGTKIKATGWFDNSDKNPHNPDPTKEVTFGEQTFEEMMVGYFDWHALP